MSEIPFPLGSSPGILAGMFSRLLGLCCCPFISLVSCLLLAEPARLPEVSSRAPGLSLAKFDIDATPPVGSQLAYDPATNKWDLGLRARGIVILGAGEPIVLCAID